MTRQSPFKVKGNFTLCIMESVPWVNFEQADAPFLKSSSQVRWGLSAATWTVPSLVSMCKGILPAQESREQARALFAKPQGRERNFNVPALAGAAGYTTAAVIGLTGALSPKPFRHFALEDSAPKALARIRSFKLGRSQPFFLIAHFRETHQPFDCPGKPPTRIQAKAIVAYNQGKDALRQQYLDYLRQQQIRCIEYLDAQLKLLHQQLPPTHFVVVADHGELFGENHRFGHTYWFHENLFKVPYCYRPPRTP